MRQFVAFFLCVAFLAFLSRRIDQVATNAVVRGTAMAANATAKQQSILECIDRLPNWILDRTGDTLGKELQVGSGGLTDKSTRHRYQLMYHRYLAPGPIQACVDSPDTKLKFRMLEIGLGCAPGGGMIRGQPGGSTRAWRYLFPPESFDLDLHVMEYDASCAMKWELENSNIATKVHTGDASLAEDLDRVLQESGGEGFDMILDDGSHLNEHQIFTLQHLIDHVKPGGIFVIEDIVSSCVAWKANVGTRTDESNLAVRGTPGCMQTSDGKPTIFAKLVDWQKPLLTNKAPFGGVTHIDIGFEAAVISKQY